MPDLGLDGLPFAVKVIAKEGQSEAHIRASVSGALGTARALMNTAKRAADGADTPHAMRSATLPDGTLVTATVSGDVSIAVVRVPPVPTEDEEQEPEIPFEPFLYVESAWIDRPAQGTITDPRDTGVVSVQTASARGMARRVSEFFHDRVALLTKNIAFELSADPNNFASQAAFEAFLSSQATNCQRKLNARNAAGYTTGLLRCWIRGKLGRRLQEVTFVSGMPLTKDLDIDGWTVQMENDCIFAGPNNFIYARKATNQFSVWYMTIDEELAPYYARFYALPDGEFKRAVAVVLLAYARAANVTATESVPAQPQIVSTTWDNTSSIWAGWRHTYWTNRALWTNTNGADANNRLLMTLREAAFTIASDAGEIQHPAFSTPFYPTPFSVTQSDVEIKSYRQATDSPRVWFPLNAGESWLIRDADPGASASCEPLCPMWAFYDDADRMVVVRAGTDEEIVIVDESNENYPLGCGTGPAAFWATSTAGPIYQMSVSVDGGAVIEGSSTPLDIRLDGEISFQGATDGGTGNSGYGPGSGTEQACAGGASWSGFGPLKRNINATRVTQTSATTTSSASSAPALVLPFSDVDAAFLLLTSATTDTLANETVVRDVLHTFAVQLLPNEATGATGSGVAFKTFDTAGSFGSSIISQDTSSENNSTGFEKAYVRTAHGYHELAVTVSNDDVWDTAVFLNLPAAFYARSDFFGRTRVSMFGQEVINDAPEGIPIGFQ